MNEAKKEKTEKLDFLQILDMTVRENTRVEQHMLIDN